MRKQKGFSLIELLIVLAIIFIIAGIAIPNLVRARMAANEAAAAGSVRTIATANVIYSATYGIGFAGTLAALSGTAGTSAAESLIDVTLAAATASTTSRAGYFFSYAAGPAGATPAFNSPNLTYSVLAQPATPTAGTSTFCMDPGNVVLKNPNGSTAGPGAGGCLTFAGGPL